MSDGVGEDVSGGEDWEKCASRKGGDGVRCERRSGCAVTHEVITAG